MRNSFLPFEIQNLDKDEALPNVKSATHSQQTAGVESFWFIFDFSDWIAFLYLIKHRYFVFVHFQPQYKKLYLLILSQL